MKKYLTMMAVIVLAIAFITGMATAATEAEKRAAIDAGLAYLASTQSTDGYWGSGLDYQLSSTGAALLSFLEEKENWGANASTYQAVVDKGLNYLLSYAEVVSISAQTAGNPDGDGNGVGLNFYPGRSTRDTYVTGLVLPAIASSGTPDKLVTVGPLAGRTDGSGAGGAWTYKDVVQNTIDYFAFGQNEGTSPGPRGGWRYYDNYGTSDQSTTQWPVIASLYATKMGVSTPNFVKSELAYWTNYIQNPDGGAGYTSPTVRYGEMNETGALLLEQAYLGWGTGDPRVQAALDYIDSGWQWTLGSGGSYDGNLGHPYAMWAIYKGLETTIGLGNTTEIANIRTFDGATMSLDPGDVWNWWEDYCEWLVDNQNKADGSWPGYSSWNTWLATPWYINILAATEIPGPGPQVPELATLLLLGLGLLGVGVIRRKS